MKHQNVQKLLFFDGESGRTERLEEIQTWQNSTVDVPGMGEWEKSFD